MLLVLCIIYDVAECFIVLLSVISYICSVKYKVSHDLLW